MTDSDVDIFHRPELAASLTRRLLGIADPERRRFESSLRYGMFLTGLRGIGKTTFLLYDLMPALGDAGALVIFVSLAECADVPPTEVFLRGIRTALKKLKSGPESYLSADVRLIKSVNWKSGNLSLSFDVDRVGEEGGVCLSNALFEVVVKAQTNLVLIVDEVQELSRTQYGKDLMWSLKATRDGVNIRPGQKDKFLFVGAGSHPALIYEMVMDEKAGFRGAHEIPYPVLGSDYVEFALKVFEKKGATKLPSLNVAVRAFEILGNEPDELEVAIAKLQDTSASATLDESLLEIANERAIEMANLQFERVVNMGPLARAIFTRLSSDGGELRIPISEMSASEFSEALGREITIEDLTPIVRKLIAANLIVRDKKGHYDVTNSLARKLCSEQQQARM